MEDVVKSMEETVEYSGAAIDYLDQLAENSIAQSESIAQLTTGVDQISAVVQTNSATSEESAAASEELSSQAVVMKQMIQGNKFVRCWAPRCALERITLIHSIRCRSNFGIAGPWPNTPVAPRSGRAGCRRYR